MKLHKAIFSIATSSLLLFSAANAATSTGTPDAQCGAQCKAMPGCCATMHSISASELKTLMDKNPSMLIVDARTAQFDTKERIGHAISLPCDSTDAVIMATLPNKSAMIAVYCGSIKCPQGKMLSEKLKKLGYTNIQECPEGIEGWKAMGYSVTKAK